ncbi:MAG: hypothetical protein ACR5LD_02265 [Symbiopectobacterium sp.]
MISKRPTAEKIRYVQFSAGNQRFDADELGIDIQLKGSFVTSSVNHTLLCLWVGLYLAEA